MADYSIREKYNYILQKVLYFCSSINYPVEHLNAQRIIGPPPNAPLPIGGTEIFVSKIPRQMFEDELFPLFMNAGNIYKFRLMLNHSGISHRGYAYVTYFSKNSVKKAIKTFDNKEILPGIKMSVAISVDNRRLFIGGIPDTKTKNQIWLELNRLGMVGIVDIIMYRSYMDRTRNRGFVFVEFASHELAATMRISYKNLIMYGNRVHVDWSTPVNEVDDNIMNKVRKLFLRNLNVLQQKEEFSDLIINILGSGDTMEKIYKFRDYAFLHFRTRRDAQKALFLLKDFYGGSDVEVTWAKPPPRIRIASAHHLQNYETSTTALEELMLRDINYNLEQPGPSTNVYQESFQEQEMKNISSMFTYLNLN